MQHQSYRIGLRGYQIVGWICALFFIGCCIGATLAAQYEPAAAFTPFILLGLFLILGSGSFEVSEDGLAHECAFGSFAISWPEVRKAEFGTQGTLVLHGVDKRFVVAPVGWWSGKQKSDAFELVRRKLAELQISPMPNKFADYRIHKNTRRR